MLKSRLQPRASCTVCVGLVLVMSAVPVRGEERKLPDAWFFPDRPAGLKGLEGNPPPALKLKSWIGDAVSVPDSQGKVVVIDFWATWCGPCMASIPHNVEVVKKYKDQGLVFVGVHDANSGWDKAPDVVKDKGINYPVAVDEAGGVTAKAFGLGFWPTYVVVDRAGIVRGAGLNPQHLEEAVKLLLSEAAPAGAAAAAGSGPPAEWFYGGSSRPAALRALEGKPMPALTAGRWLETPLGPADWKDRVVILQFVASGNGAALKQAEVLAALEHEMGPQGVMVVCVAPADDDWDALAKMAGDGRLPSRLCQDAPAGGDQPAGVGGATAAAYGVRYVPCTIVMDRAGQVRAAGARVERVKEIAGKLLAESTHPRDVAPAAGGGN